jgi:chromosome segregation ATPase
VRRLKGRVTVSRASGRTVPEPEIRRASHPRYAPPTAEEGAGVADNQLRETLAELHRELDRTEAVDEQARAELAAVARDIQGLLDRSERTREEHASLLERLAQAMQRFEEEHPSLTEAIGRVAGALSNLGI